MAKVDLEIAKLKTVINQLLWDRKIMAAMFLEMLSSKGGLWEIQVTKLKEWAEETPECL